MIQNHTRSCILYGGAETDCRSRTGQASFVRLLASCRAYLWQNKQACRPAMNGLLACHRGGYISINQGAVLMNGLFKRIVIVTGVMAVCAGPTFANKPDSAGNSGKNQPEYHHEPGSRTARESTSHQSYFSEERQRTIRRYYSQTSSSGNCPPGLARKNNGCQPPGQAKKWSKGRPLPSDIAYYDLPRALLYELGRLPEGQKIVRVGTDLLLISIGTGLVIDALENLDDIF